MAAKSSFYFTIGGVAAGNISATLGFVVVVKAKQISRLIK